MKLWGGRFESGPSEVFERFSNSLHFDRRLIFADIQGSQAFARALAKQGILTENECARLIEAFDQIARDARNPQYFHGATDEDVHTFVIRKLGELVGPLAEKIHTGRSRNEQVSLDIRLYLRECVDTLLRLLADFMGELLALARKYPQAIIPGYTHLRRAQAVLWPHYLLAYFEMSTRDFERFQQVRGRINVMPLGSGALAGSGFAIDRGALAKELGFDAITRNSMDVSADRDFALDFLFACSTVMLHLSRLAEDWILYSSEEFNWMTLGDSVTSGSSLMPQKNNRDMQEDKEPLFEAFDQTSGSLEMAAAVAQSVTLNPKIPAASAEESWVVATDLAEELARRGVPFHRAHQLVGKLVLESVKAGKSPSDWDAASLAAFAPEFHPDMAQLLRPGEGMKTRELPGGTGPRAVARALAEAEERLAALRATLPGRG